MTVPNQPAQSTYVDNAVFQPGTGGVFHAAPGTPAPSLAEVHAWATGDRTRSIGDWDPLGYTSVESLPGIGTETEGGEKKGVWENPDFRVTPITSTDTINVSPVQWSPIPISHRFGAGVTFDRETGQANVPARYTPVETAIMVVILDGDNPLVLHYFRASSAPNGDLELDPENFAALPVSYTVLSMTGNPNKMTILSYSLMDADADGIPDRAPVPGLPEDPEDPEA